MPGVRRRLTRINLCTLLAATLMAATAMAGSRWRPSLPAAIPAALWEAALPEHLTITPERVTLGRDLFFDKRLSLDSSISCATCHDPRFGFSDGQRVSEGVGGKKGARHAPTVLNAMFNSEQFWDGRAATLEEQTRGPLTNRWKWRWLRPRRLWIASIR